MAFDITTTVPNINYTAAGGQTVFSVPFGFFANADLAVYDDGVFQTLNVHYTVTGAGVTGGGAITFATGRTLDAVIHIHRTTPNARTSAYVTGGGLAANALETDLDKLVCMSQEQETRLSRTVHSSALEGVLAELPLKTARSGKFLYFDPAGNPTAVTGDPTQPLTVYYQSYTALGGEGAVTTLYPYTPGAHQLWVFVNGEIQEPTVDYLETDTDTITFTTPLIAGDTVLLLTGSIFDVANVVLFEQTAAEAAAGVVPVDTDYPPGDVRRYGAVGDGVTDDTTAIQTALDLAYPTIFQNATYLISTGITWNIQHGTIHANGAQLTTSADITALTIGILGSGNNLIDAKVYGNLHVNQTGSRASSKGILFQQCYEGYFNVSATGFARNFELTSDASGCVYNQFFISKCANHDYGVYFSPASTGWVNENNFYGGRFAQGGSGNWHIYMADTGSASGQPGNNKFYGISLEAGGASTMDGLYYDGGGWNLLDHPRIEANGTINDVEIHIATGAIASCVLFPYSAGIGAESAANKILDEGLQSQVLCEDRLSLQARGHGAATTALYISRERSNSSTTPIGRFRDLYNGSGNSMGLQVDLARPTANGYYFRGDDVGSIVINNGVEYECILTHTSGAADDEPGVGAVEATYWARLGTQNASGAVAWVTATGYTGTATKVLWQADGALHTNSMVLNTVAPTVASGEVGYGATTAANATNGTGEVMKANVEGYLIVNIAGTPCKIPYVKN